MAQDISPFINYDPASYLPTRGGRVSGQSGASKLAGTIDPFVDGLGIGGVVGDAAKLLDPGGIGILDSLFGDKPSWKPYVGEDGMYYWKDPKNGNPVPITDIPGVSQKPSKEYQKVAEQAKILQQLLPYMSGAVNDQLVPTAEAELAASQATSGPYAELMTQLYNQYGPQLNAIGNEIQRRNALAQAERDNEVITGPGKELVANALELSKMQDPEYYATRELTASRLGDLMNSADLTGALSDTEMSSIARGNARDLGNRGISTGASNTDTVANAMRYGEKTFQRKQAGQDALTKAIQASSAFLPTAKSGGDPFQVATGRSSQSNPGNSMFTGINKTDNSGAFGLAGQTLGNATQLQNTQMQIDANKKDWLDKFVQFTQGLSNVGSMVGNVAGGLV
jgi:hypothetical protein